MGAQFGGRIRPKVGPHHNTNFASSIQGLEFGTSNKNLRKFQNINAAHGHVPCTFFYKNLWNCGQFHVQFTTQIWRFTQRYQSYEKWFGPPLLPRPVWLGWHSAHRPLHFEQQSCERDTANKPSKLKNKFDTVGYGKVCSCAQCTHIQL